MKPTLNAKEMDQPTRVVCDILHGFERGKKVGYPGKLASRLSTWGARFLPRNDLASRRQNDQQAQPELVFSGDKMTQASSAVDKVRIGSTAVGALAVGAVAFGAMAIGALAVGAMTVRRLRVLEARIEKLSIGTLTVDRLDVRGQ